MIRPAQAVFCGAEALAGKDRVLAIHEDAIGATYKTVDPDGWYESYQGEMLSLMLADTDGVAIVPVEGPLEHHRNWCWQSYDGIVEAVTRSAEHPDCHSIVLEIDSPGGDVSGCFEAVKTMRALSAKTGKPIYAFANEAAYSAAYAIACAASEIYLPEAGGVGSIGVIATMCDRTKMTAKMGLNIQVIKSGARKAFGHPDVPLSDAAKSAMQTRVNDLAQLFFRLVSSARPLKAKAVASYEADTFHGEDAITKGLADGVLSFADVVSAARSSVESTPKTKVTKQGESAMSTLLALKNKVTKARAKRAAAKAPKTKAAADTALKAAIGEFNAALAAAKLRGDVAAKTVKKEKYEKVEETDDEEGAEDAEDAEEDAEEADEDAEDADEDAEDAEDAGDDGDDEGDEEDDDEEEDAAAASASNATELLAAVTGTRNLAKQRGVLMAMQESHKKVAKLDAQVSVLTRESKKAKVEALIMKGQKLGKLSPGMLAWARETGMKSPATLRAYIKSAPKIHALDEASAGRNPAQGGGGAGGNVALGLSAAEVTIATNMGISLEAFAAQKATKASNGSLRH